MNNKVKIIIFSLIVLLLSCNKDQQGIKSKNKDDIESVSKKMPKFVAIALGSDKAAYSEDGIKWKTTTLPYETEWQSVCYGGD